MLEQIYNLEERRRLIEALLANANAHLIGEIGPIETARALSVFLDRDRALDDLLGTFVGVSSETDSLPLGPERGHWGAEALKSEDIKIAKAEAWCRKMVADACQDLVAALTPLLAELRDQRP